MRVGKTVVTEHYHVHSYTPIVTDPTCTEAGYNLYECCCCLEQIPEETTPALGHAYELVDFLEPTCTEAGYDVYRCDVCNDFYSIDYPPEHTWSEGGLTFWCTVCGYGYPYDDGMWSLRSGPTLESTVTQTYSYVYNGSSLSQMTVATLTASPDGLETTTTTDTLNFFYSASGDPLYVDYNGTPYYYAANLQGYLEL